MSAKTDRVHLQMVAGILSGRLRGQILAGRLSQKEADLIANRALEHYRGLLRILDQVDELDRALEER